MSDRLTDEQLTGIEMAASSGDYGNDEASREIDDLVTEVRESRALIERQREEIASLEEELAKVRAALERDCNATAIAGITPGMDHPLTEHASRLQARLRLDHDEKCSVIVQKLQIAQAELAKSDRRTAEQEGIMAKQREKLAVMREAIRSYVEDTDYCALCGNSYVCSSGHARGCVLSGVLDTP